MQPVLESGQRRRGAVVVSVSITMVVIMGFAMLVVDVGRLYSVKSELQRAADAAALAGVSSYVTDAGLTYDTNALSFLIPDRSQETSYQNVTLQDGTILSLSDVEWGRHAFDNPLVALAPGERWNSVEVVVRKSPQTANGGVPYLFAPVFGHLEGSVTATARAAIDDRVAGYDFSEGSGFLPFTVHTDLFDDMVANGPDDYSYDDHVDNFGDGIPEIKIFPWKWSDEDEALLELNGNNGNGNNTPDGNDAAGNFGTLNIGVGDQGTAEIENQILNGISAEQMEAEFGTAQLIFYNEEGELQTHIATGNPGLSVGMRDSVEAQIGKIVGFFVHNDSYDTGSNADFVITGIRFARVLNVKITGNPNQRALTLQPVAYTDENLILDDAAPPNGMYVGRFEIVK